MVYESLKSMIMTSVEKFKSNSLISIIINQEYDHWDDQRTMIYICIKSWLTNKKWKTIIKPNEDI